MEYIEVYFRVKSAYQYDSGFTSDREATAFHEEVCALFAGAGWEVCRPSSSACSDTVTRGLRYDSASFP